MFSQLENTDQERKRQEIVNNIKDAYKTSNARLRTRSALSRKSGFSSSTAH